MNMVRIIFQDVPAHLLGLRYHPEPVDLIMIYQAGKEK